MDGSIYILWFGIYPYISTYMLGMGVGDFLSSKAEDDHEIAERRREKW